jgi:hypothetical protein
MIVVVADTSPINYLVLIGQIEILPRLYSTVLVPPEVVAELADSGARWRYRTGFGHGRIGFKYGRAVQARATLHWSWSMRVSAQRFCWRKRSPMFCCLSMMLQVARKPTVGIFQTQERSVYLEPLPCVNSWIFHLR